MTQRTADQHIAQIVPAEKWPVLGWGELWRMRRILFVLAQRILKVRYQHTASRHPLGRAAAAHPGAHRQRLHGLRHRPRHAGDLPFAVWLFPAWVAWRTFQKVVNEGGGSVNANGALVQRIYLPRIFFPMAVSLASLVDLVFMMLAQLALQAAYGIVPGKGMLLVPVAVVIMYMAALGFSFFFSSSSLQYRDMDIIKPLLVQAWFWMSPIIYPATQIPEDVRTFYCLNPMAVVIESFRYGLHELDAATADGSLGPRLLDGLDRAHRRLLLLPAT